MDNQAMLRADERMNKIEALDCEQVKSILLGLVCAGYISDETLDFAINIFHPLEINE